MTPELIKSVVDKTDSRRVEKNQLFCYLAYFYTELTYEKIGTYVNQKRSHVFYSIGAINNRIKTERNYMKKVNDLKLLLKPAMNQLE